jgi:hypothetical protein
VIRRLVIAFLLAAAPLVAEIPSQRVGLPLVVREIHIPGGEVRPKPRRDREPPLVVRVLEIKPAKGGSRYDFEIHGLEPGSHDLADFLEPVDAAAAAEIPSIPLNITTALPEGLLVPPPVTPGQLPELGGYRTKMIALAAVWAAGLLGILAWRRKKPVADGAAALAPPSLAERLRPLVDRAAKGGLSDGERASLERLVIGHWRAELPEIAAMAPAEALAALRQHPQASPLILAMERWLHARSSEVGPAEIERLLKPYA